nr:hypothetical protein [Oscillospiraceae bacterium]
MYRGKFASRSRCRIGKRSGILLASIVLVLGISIGTTVAYLLDQTGSVVNTFTPATVTVDVEETFQNNIKENVALRNKSNIKVYVRATIAEYWKKGNDIVAKPDGGSVNKVMGVMTNWLEKNGIYYYKTPLDPGAVTAELIDKVTVEIPEGYTYHLDVYAEAIQAEPASAVASAWGVQFAADGITISGVD